MELEYHIVDVFTDQPLAGNPLAVVFNDGSLTTEKMQSIAREFNLSETFVERRSTASLACACGPRGGSQLAA